MRNTILVVLLAVAACSSCRMIGNLAGDGKAGTVENLWPDVPPIAGATKADLALPLGARLAIRAMMQGKVSFIAFTTDQTPIQIQDFYSKDRMKAAGWIASEKGCVSDTEETDSDKNKNSGKESQGAVCLFNHQNGSKKEGLAIVMAQDKKSKQTDIFYARIDLTETVASPSP